MKPAEMRKMNAEELKEAQQKLWREQVKLRVAKAMGEIENVHRFKQIRQSLARIETILSEQEKAK